MPQPPVVIHLIRGLEMRMDKLWRLLQWQRAFLEQKDTHHFLSLTQQIERLAVEIKNHWSICLQWRSVLDPPTEKQWQQIWQLLTQARCYQEDTQSLLIQHLEVLQQQIAQLRVLPRSLPLTPEESEAVMVNTQV